MFHCKNNWNEWSVCLWDKKKVPLFSKNNLSLPSLSLSWVFGVWVYAVEVGVHHYLIIQVGKVEKKNIQKQKKKIKIITYLSFAPNLIIKLSISSDVTLYNTNLLHHFLSNNIFASIRIENDSAIYCVLWCFICSLSLFSYNNIM